MPIRSEDLHGFVPDTSGTALLLIDVINDFEFDDGERLLKLAIPVGHNVAELKSRARAAKVPSIYVNDNFGKWQSDFRKIVDHCRSVRGKPFVELLLPDEDDYFVLKPKHSGFYSTSLGLLLNHLTATNLILTGIAGNNCVLFTANDAYMRELKIYAPPDCIVSNTPTENEQALQQIETVLKGHLATSTQIAFRRARA